MFCSECGKQIADSSVFCSGCGVTVRKNVTEKYTQVVEKKHSKLMLYLAAVSAVLFFLFVAYGSVVTSIENNRMVKVVSGEKTICAKCGKPIIDNTKNIQVKKKEKENVSFKVSKAICEDCKVSMLVETKEIIKSYNWKKPPEDQDWVNLLKAQQFLETLETESLSEEQITSHEYLKSEWSKIEKNYQIVLDKAVVEILEMQVDKMLDALDTAFLKMGMDVTITIEGKNKDTIRFKYILMSRPLAYKLANEGGLYQGCKKAGFKKMIFDDGDYHTWPYDLTK